MCDHDVRVVLQSLKVHNQRGDNTRLTSDSTAGQLASSPRTSLVSPSDSYNVRRTSGLFNSQTAADVARHAFETAHDEIERLALEIVHLDAATLLQPDVCRRLVEELQALQLDWPDDWPREFKSYTTKLMLAFSPLARYHF